MGERSSSRQSSSHRGNNKKNESSHKHSSKGHHNGHSSPIEDSFQARPTNRMGKDHKIKADGDTWQEMMAVCEAPEGMNSNGNADEGDSQLVIRSYYQNSRTNERVWDEPPSGATNIIPASDEVRRMANMQLNELHLVKRTKKSKPKKKTLMNKIFGTGGKKKDKKKEKKRIEYKPGSTMYARQAQQDTEDAMMQEAIAASMAESRGEEYVRPSQPTPGSRMDEEMAMAAALSVSAAQQSNKEKNARPQGPSLSNPEEDAIAHALSLSAAEHEKATREKDMQDMQETTETDMEEQMLLLVMEQSKLETKRGEGDLLNLSGDNPNMGGPPVAAGSNAYMRSPRSPEDRKMPATGPAAMSQEQMYQLHQFPSMSTSLPYASAAAGAMPPISVGSTNPSAQYAASTSASAAASASQYAAAMAASSAPAAASPPPSNMKAPPSNAMNSSSASPPPPSNYQNTNMLPGYGGAPSYLQPPGRSSAIAPTVPMVNPPRAPSKSMPPPLPPAAANSASPFNTAPMLSSVRSSSVQPQPSSAAIFDPYSKTSAGGDGKPPAATKTHQAPHSSSSPSSSSLKKMYRSSDRKKSWIKRKSGASTKVQNKAGLV